MAKDVLPLGRCPNDPGHETYRARGYTASGALQVFDWCAECGRYIHHGKILWIPHDQAGDTENFPIHHDYRPQNPPCAVCGGSGTELHHWAPRNVFGEDAEHWPMTYLCRTHHAEWHNLMDGYKRYGRNRD